MKKIGSILLALVGLVSGLVSISGGLGLMGPQEVVLKEPARLPEKPSNPVKENPTAPAIVSPDVDKPVITVRINEGVSERVCRSADVLRFTVNKNLSEADGAILLSRGNESFKVLVGEEFSLSDACLLRLDRTGKTVVFFAEFTIISGE